MEKGKSMKCPKCGYEIEAQQNRAAKSRWANMTKAERAAEMSRIRNKGVKNQKRIARRSNAEPSEAADTRRTD
jgi:DNA-directed RNA polymerase subunit M/transcription elongation factor TFIIS